MVSGNGHIISQVSVGNGLMYIHMLIIIHIRKDCVSSCFFIVAQTASLSPSSTSDVKESLLIALWKGRFAYHNESDFIDSSNYTQLLHNAIFQTLPCKLLSETQRSLHQSKAIDRLLWTRRHDTTRIPWSTTTLQHNLTFQMLSSKSIKSADTTKTTGDLTCTHSPPQNLAQHRFPPKF